jgi:hypothetical protein
MENILARIYRLPAERDWFSLIKVPKWVINRKIDQFKALITCKVPGITFAQVWMVKPVLSTRKSSNSTQMGNAIYRPVKVI